MHFDCNATTAASEEVIEAMARWMGRPGSNPSATHPAGREAARAVRAAREAVAALVGARAASEIVFTSGGSESTVTAIRSALEAGPGRGAVLSSVEHSATKAAVGTLAPPDAVQRVAVDRSGALDRAALDAALDAALATAPAVASLILVNNETGVVTDLEGVGEACRAAGALLHVDAVQAPGKVPIDVEALGCDYLSLSAHKFHGPRGVGALFVRKGAPISPLIVGGPQEGERRAGTENVPGIVGMGVAAARAAERAGAGDGLLRVAALRDRLESRILAGCAGASVNGAPDRRVANTTNIGFDLAGTGVDATAMLAMLHEQGFEVSAGSACNATRSAPSPVLLAMGRSEEEAASALRFSIAHPGTPDAVSESDVDACAAAVIEAHGALAALRA